MEIIELSKIKIPATIENSVKNEITDESLLTISPTVFAAVSPLITVTCGNFFTISFCKNGIF